MIRFIDMGSQVYLDDVDVQHSIAFLDTRTDKFLEFNGSVYWDSYKDFVDDFQASLSQGGTARREAGFWTRLSGLVPANIKMMSNTVARDKKSYIAGQPIAFSIYLNNGYCITIRSIDNIDIRQAEIVELQIGCVGYRYLKLDPRLHDSQWASVTPEELIVALNTVLLFDKSTGLPEAERILRHNLHRPL